MKRDNRRDTGSYIWSYHSETPSERKLSAALRKAGVRFGREVPVKGFTVDFLVDQWLVIEVDGESHLVKGRAEKDVSRQQAIEAAGFTVMRVPAGDLSSDGLKRWVKRILERAAEGPPYLNQGRSSNNDYLRQIEEAKKALRIGEAERKKREAEAFDSRGKGQGAEDRRGRGSSGPGESMEDYFGKESEDFGALLDRRDWGRAVQGAWGKDDDSPKDTGGGRPGRSPSSRKRGAPRRR